MKVWIDVLTPKHLLFFLPIAEELKTRGHDVLITARAHPELPKLLEIKGVDARIIGSYGHTLQEKLIAFAERVKNLANLIGDFSPDVTLSFSSPEAARVSFGLGVPHVSFNNSPHAVHAAKLTLPLSDYLFTPFVYSKKEWSNFGIPKERIIQYKALDEVIWLKHFSPNPNVLREFGISSEEKYVLIREIESSASYIITKYGRGFMLSKIVIPAVQEACRDCTIVVSVRYRYQAEAIEREFGEEVIVQKEPTDTTSLIYYAYAFIGGGGTMTKEAVFLGVPSVSVFPMKLKEIDYLAKKGALIYCPEPTELSKVVKKLISDERLRKKLSLRGKKLFNTFEDPLKVIVEKLSEVYAI